MSTHPSLFSRILMAAALPCAIAFGSSLAPLPLPDVAGVANFHQVDDHVYRGAQPTAEGFENLAKLGIKTVIDLRGAEHSVADEQRMVEAAGMRYVSIPMLGMKTPTDQQISKVLALMNDTSAGPVFVHCKRGADRTGATVACYRIQHDRWDSGKALSEARNLGMSWYQVALQHYVRGFSQHSLPSMASILTLPGLVP